jgi:predicted Zn finger-like uncharacterized protein
MIISCKCGKYQFTIKKSDMPNNGREVQCGICNETWFHGLGSQNNKLSINKSFKNPFLYQLIIYIIIILSIIGIVDMLEEFFISLNTQFQNYYVAKEQLIQKILTIIKK